MDMLAKSNGYYFDVPLSDHNHSSIPESLYDKFVLPGPLYIGNVTRERVRFLPTKKRKRKKNL